MRNFRESPPPPLPHSEPHKYGIFLPLFLGFVIIKWVFTQPCIEQDLNPAVGGVSDRVKLSRLRRQIRTFSAFLPACRGEGDDQ